MRLDKMLSHATGLSRREVKQLLKTHQVTLDGEPVSDGSRHINACQQLYLNDEPIATPQPRYFMLHKPKGYVCSHSDGNHPVVPSLFCEPRSEALQMVGRLDVDTTGMLLITDDGHWNHALMSPKHHCSKTYRVETLDPIDPELIALFAQGIKLNADAKPTRPARLELINPRLAKLVIVEGRYHQVKRMFAASGNHVVSLHREAIGNLALDPQLSPGDYRPLEAHEHALLGVLATQ